ncbi:MAG: S8 family serine peptidase [Myxococcota bacterium]
MVRFSLFVCALIGNFVVPPVWAGASTTVAGEIIPGRYLVQLADGVSPHECAAEMDQMLPEVAPGDIFSEALTGFVCEIQGTSSAEVEATVSAIAADPRVVGIEVARVMTVPGLQEEVEAPFNGRNGELRRFRQILFKTPVPQITPQGVDRVDGDLHPGTGAGIHLAQIDSGFPLDHEDWPLPAGGVDFVNEPGVAFGQDTLGHATMTGGVIVAQDNGFGVVGIAPDIDLWFVKIFGSSAFGSSLDAFRALEWVASTRTDADPNNDMDIALLEFDLLGNSPAFCDAISRMTSLGIVVVAAAGNSQWDAGLNSPANCPDAIAVSSMSDSDGLPGGIGDLLSQFERDDYFSVFSNYGSVVDIAAPGARVLTTSINPLTPYRSPHGTSMAVPHVAAAAALYLEAHPGATPTQFREALLSGAWSQHGTFGFLGDPDQTSHPHGPGLDEPVLNVNAPELGGRPLRVELAALSAADVFRGEPYDILARPKSLEETGVGVTIHATVNGPGGTQLLGAQSLPIAGGTKGKAQFEDICDLTPGLYTATVTIEQSGATASVPFTIK